MQETLTNTTESPSDPIISVKSLWKIFGNNQDEIVNSDDGETDKTEVLQDYGDVIALNDVSFDVYPGETFVVMGLSGSGKSTLVRCLLRLIEPSSGEININDDDILLYDADRLREFRRNEMAMVFQHFGLLPHRNVIDNAAYGLEIKGVDKDERYEIAQEMLNKVGLEGWEEARTSELSGGMQQRVGLARALTVDPTILLMDEPFSGLDPLIRRQMREELADLQAELQKTIVFITHDLDEAVTIGDRIAIMRDGRITQLGTPEDIITNPIDDFVKEFTRDISQTRVLSVQSIASDLEQVFENNTGVSEIIQAMEDTGKEFAFIVDDDSKLLGFIDKEAIEGAADDVCLKDMDLSVIEPIHESTVIEDVVQLTLDNPYPIPIVDDENILTGLATHDAILQAFAENALQQQTN